MDSIFLVITSILFLGSLGALFVGDEKRFIIGACLMILSGVVYGVIDNWASIQKFLDIPYMKAALIGLCVIGWGIAIHRENKQRERMIEENHIEIERMKKEHP